MISGTEIAAARQRANLSQKALADLLGTDVKTINNWETGRTKPRQVEAIRRFIANHPADGAPALELLTDNELLTEIARRLARSTKKEGQAHGTSPAEKSDDGTGGGASVTRLQPPAPQPNAPAKRAARKTTDPRKE